MNPFLENEFHIRWSSLRPNHIEADISKALEDAESAVDRVASQAEPLTYENTIVALDNGLETLSRAWKLVSHLDSVCNSPELREAYNKMLPPVTAFFSGIPLNEKLWITLKAFGESDAVHALSETKQRYVAETLADFRESGADLAPEQKERARTLKSKLAERTQKYSENCLDAINAWEKIVTDEGLLSGLPESTVASAKQDAERKGHPNAWRFTLHAPSYIAVMTYADSDELREEVWRAFAAIGRGKEYNNIELVREILDLRQEFAQLVGQDDFANHVTERRMVASGDAALRFTESIFDKVQDQFKQEGQALRDHKAAADSSSSALGDSPLLEPWQALYWAEKQRNANYDFDEEELRPYFPIDRVIEGLFDIAQELFGLRVSQRTDVEVWHEEVKFYDLFDNESGEHLGSFYADWHPRESKRGGAWMNYLLTGDRDDTRSPHLGLICGNLTPSVGDKPALLTHREVETIFHEFGHLLHHLCGEVEVKSLNGVNVAWDFVELPSQIMENWCWERESLDRFARHYETGEAIPEELFSKMLAARNYMKASANVRQLSIGKMDLELHINWPRSNKEDLDTFIESALEGYTPELKTKAKPNPFNLGHLFSNSTGYAAGYYSYKWAEVLDADAFTRFQKEGILNPKTGRDFRDKILAKGNSEDPAKLYEDFMERGPDPDALLRRDGLIA